MAVFPYSPDFGYEGKHRYNVGVSQFENQVEEARLLSSKKLRTWDNLEFTARTKTERDAAVAFFDSQKENLTEFDLVIDGETVTGKFVPDTFKDKRVAYGIWHYYFGFKETA